LKVPSETDPATPSSLASNKREAARMDFVIDLPEQPALPVIGTSGFFPVRRIYCIGRNYAEHAREMGHDPDREPPFFFQKNPQNICFDGTFVYPEKTSNVHFELEMIVALKSGGSDIPQDRARACIYGYGVGLDMTRRDLQAEAKKLGRPWDVAKAFEGSLPCTPIVPAEGIGHPRSGAIWLDVNGTPAQRGDLSQMIWSVEEQVSRLSEFVELAAGDLILTGTPAGVGAIVRGDQLRGGVDGLGEIDVRVL
jgi:fumarylpyruvate hydrolase